MNPCEAPVRTVSGIRYKKEMSTFLQRQALVNTGRSLAAAENNQRTDGRNVCRVEIVLCKTDDQTCFAHSAVSDEQQLEKKIILFRHGWKCSSEESQNSKTFLKALFIHFFWLQ